MVKKEIQIGIIGIQGAISEHKTIFEKTLKKTNTKGIIKIIKKPEDIGRLDGLVIPGGESTTISSKLIDTGLFDEIKKRIIQKNLPIMGTCAGCVILAKKIKNNNKNVELLKAVDMKVERNSFGRQKESFEQYIKIKGFNKPFNAVFIRAPIILETWNKCEILSDIDKRIVMVRQNNFLALSFHPELTDDIRIHEYFLKIIKKNF